MASLNGNPRMSSQADRLRERLKRRIPDMRRSIQALVSRMAIATDDAPSSPPPSQTLTADSRTRLGPGVHPEATLRADRDRFTGRVDLLTVHRDRADIVDFKTGAPTDHHAAQVVLYGLLWMLDTVANPDGIPVGSLTLAYISGEQDVPAPTDWDVTRRVLAEQIASADDAVVEVPPQARPSTECQRCPVRHICEEYWTSAYVTREAGAAFVDSEVVVLSRNGPKSWSSRLVHDSRKVLLRTTTEDENLEAGQRLRVLDAAVGEVEDESWTVLTVTTGSELYRIPR
jgi:PD-(D/E)XK nuclease superfamily